MRMKAILEVEFDSHKMCDSATAKDSGGWLNMMKWLFKEEGFGIFDKPIKLVKVVKVKED